MSRQTRQLAKVITAQNTSDGAGVKLKRAFGGNQQQKLFDPFLLLDEFATEEATDYIGGFPDHPHRGFETVTYMLEGAMLHRDHLGNEGHLRAGSVQWMTAAHGIIHSEMPEQEHGLLHGFQLWINLPASDKMKPPQYQEYTVEQIPEIDLAKGGKVKIIAGDFSVEGQHVSGPVKGIVTQPVYFDISLAPEQQLTLPIEPDRTVLIYLYQGELCIDASNRALKPGQLGWLDNGNEISAATDKHPARFLLLAAKPLNEPVVQSGPFVMNSKEEIDQAFWDYRNGVLTSIVS